MVLEKCSGNARTLVQRRRWIRGMAMPYLVSSTINRIWYKFYLGEDGTRVVVKKSNKHLVSIVMYVAISKDVAKTLPFWSRKIIKFFF
jgi:hypothetical protein